MYPLYLVSASFGPMSDRSRRKQHSVRATVIAHIDHTVGHLWWKQRVPSLRVRIDEPDFQQLCRVLQEETESTVRVEARELTVGFETTEEQIKHAVGASVWLRYSTLSPIDQFLTREKAHQWEGLEELQPVYA